MKSTILSLVWTDDEHVKTHKSCLELKQLPKIVQLDLENAKKGASAPGDDDLKVADFRHARRTVGHGVASAFRRE